MAKCMYCGECEENAPRDKHNVYCPNQYPIKECRDMAITDWKRGYTTTGMGVLALKNAGDEIVTNPVFALGHRMKNPDSRLGLD